MSARLVCRSASSIQNQWSRYSTAAKAPAGFPVPQWMRTASYRSSGAAAARKEHDIS